MPPLQSTKPAGGLLRSSLLVGSMTMLSRVLGLCRDVVFAIFIGANANAFFIAFKVPNFFRRLFAEGAFSQAFVPVLSEYRTQREHREVRQLVNSVAGSLGVVLLGFCIFAVLAAPVVTTVFNRDSCTKAFTWQYRMDSSPPEARARSAVNAP